MSKSQGFVMIPRDITKLSIWDNPQDVAILLYCVLHASYKDHDDLKTGQFYTSRLDMAEDLHMCRNTFSKHFAGLVQNGYFRVQHNKRGTIVTVLDWEHFAKGIDFFCTADDNCTENEQDNTLYCQPDAQEMISDAQILCSVCTKNDPYQYREETKESLSAPSGQRERERAFEVWWAAYPRHNSRKAAFQAFMRHKATPDQLMQALDNAKQTREWLECNGRFIPKAENWLDGAWVDYLPGEVERMQKERRECKTY